MAQQSLSQSQNRDHFYQSQIENLQFELKVEQLKVEKMRKEWTIKRYKYTQEVNSLQNENSKKTIVLEKLENQLREMAMKVKFFYESYQEKDVRNIEIEQQIKEIQADKYKVEVILAREKEKDAKLNYEIEKNSTTISQLKDQLKQSQECIQKLSSDKQKLSIEKKKEYERALDFLKIITTSQKELQKQSSEQFSFIQLFNKAIDQIFAINEKRFHSELDLMEQRLKLTQQNMRKLKGEFQKINAERLFYKSMYKKRILNEAQNIIPLAVKQYDHSNIKVNSTIIAEQNIGRSQYKDHERQNSFQKSSLFQEVLIKQSKEMNEILGLIENQKQSTINTLQISPIKMFNLDRDLSKQDSNYNLIDYQINDQNFQVNASQNDNNVYEIDTFRSQEVEQALEKAHHLMKFKHDKEFINKVLDAQIRVNEIESNIIKNATSLTNSKRSNSKSSSRKPNKEQNSTLNKKQTKYDYSAMSTLNKPLRN